MLAASGKLIEPVHEIPLADFGASPGYLVIGARSPGEPLTGADRELLVMLAPHVAAMANGALLVGELRGSRTGIVLAREEERRRLRRDLHDGLGAALSGIGYGLDAVALAAPEAPERLQAVRAQLTGVQAELRRIIDDLRPSLLDSAGLAAAVRADVRSRADGRVRIETDIAETGALPAGLELAAYRVVQEALTNALRHACADRVDVSLRRDGEALVATVCDNGVGIPPDRPPGVGLTSMAERVAEVGGMLSVASTRPGTRVAATFPVAGSHMNGTSAPVPPGEHRS